MVVNVAVYACMSHCGQCMINKDMLTMTICIASNNVLLEPKPNMFDMIQNTWKHCLCLCSLERGRDVGICTNKEGKCIVYSDKSQY